MYLIKQCNSSGEQILGFMYSVKPLLAVDLSTDTLRPIYSPEKVVAWASGHGLYA